MSASSEFEPNTSNDVGTMPLDPGDEPGMGREAVPQEPRSNRAAGFWLGTVALVALGSFGVVGQFMGLRSIDAYARVRVREKIEWSYLAVA